MTGLTKGAGKPAPQTSTERGDKRKAEIKAAALLNGFAKWSTMITYIKNEAKKGRAVVLR